VGPFKAGVSNNTILKESGVMEKLKEANKTCVVDRGFHMKEKDLEAHLSFPDYMDDTDLHEFKNRIRCRQETFNSRLQFFSSLSQIFEYGFDKHKLVTHAVAGIVQYQMDLGSPIYEV
jgi:hypothetical protein